MITNLEQFISDYLWVIILCIVLLVAFIAYNINKDHSGHSDDDDYYWDKDEDTDKNNKQ